MSNSWSESSDTSLVIAVGRFEQQALAEIYRRHGGPVHNLALRVLQDHQLADDVTQDVFVELWNDPTRYDADRASLRSWLLMKAHGRSVDLVRAEEARRKRNDRQLNDRVHGNELSDRYDLDREIWDLAVADRVQTAMSELGTEERKAITLAYFGGHSYRAVAELLGEAEGTTKSRIRNGLKILGRKLRDLDDSFHETPHDDHKHDDRKHDNQHNTPTQDPRRKQEGER
jgi:RNA polymerase sigma-70 factor, ECF subfamily